MKIEGGCHCGRIAYEAEVDPATAAICNCTDCQTMSGSAFRTVVFCQSADFRLLRGELKAYLKTAESGNQRIQAFCPDCGTHIYASAPGDGPKVMSLRVGAIRQRDRLVPRTRYWHRSAQAWLAGIVAIPAVERS